MLLGSQFSATFAEVVLAINAVIISVALVTAYFDKIAGACATALHRLSATLAFLVGHLGPRHK